MADGLVRQAVQAWLAGASIPGLQKVYLDVPWFIDGNSWDLTSNDWGAISMVHLNDSKESRLTLGAAIGGTKMAEHTVAVIVRYQYLIPDNLPTGQDFDAWVTGLDTIIDGIKDRIRSSPTLGTAPGGVVFQAGQSQNDIRITRDMPLFDGGRVWSWSAIEFDVTEVITA